MLTITENIPDASARRPAIGTLRMRLKPAHRSCGFVQGAWWPRSTELTSELPSLLAALSLRVGSIDSVLYHESDWSPAPLSIKHQGDQVIAQCPPRVAERRICVRTAVREVGPAGGTPIHRTHARLQRGDDCGQRQRCVHTRPTTRNHTPRATIACSPPSRLSDGNPTEAQCHQPHGHSLRCRTPEHLTRAPIDCGADAQNPLYDQWNSKEPPMQNASSSIAEINCPN